MQLINGVLYNALLLIRLCLIELKLGTYLIASALAGKKINILNINPKIIKTEIKILKKMGVKN